MKIAQVAPLFESVPPKLYGGTVRVVSYLTEELLRQGQDVTLFASGDSVTGARLVAGCRNTLRIDPLSIDPTAHLVVMLERLFREADRFDIIHFHCDYLHFPLSRRYRVPQLTTLHGRLDIPDLAPLFREFDEMPVVSISDAQRRPLHFANWVGTVHHGLPPDLYTLHERPGGYLAFLGRICPEKGVDRAIEIARRVGMPLKIAAKVDKADREYFHEVVKPLLDYPLVEFVGEIGEREKDEFLGNAFALLFPIDWPEPFGLVVIEAMACGTPVIAWRNGSVPELIEPGVNGIIVESIDEAVRALERVPRLSRRAVRGVFERRFLASRMAERYLSIYKKVLSSYKRVLSAGRGTRRQEATAA
jgi:glycosyltransferase involved in cell wall biosynthesis